MSGDYATNLLVDLDRLRGYSAALQGLMRGAVFTPPDDERGADPTRSVTVAVDSGGLPTQVRIVGDWVERLGAHDLGSAITTAHQAALHQRMTLWEKQLQTSGWAEDLAEFRAEIADGRLPTALVAAIEPPAPVRRSRPLTEIAEDAVAALQQATAPSQPSAADPDPTVDASVARGRIELGYTAAGGLVATVDADWARTQSASTLMTYFDHALDMLRLKVSRNAEAAPAASFGGLDDLFGEAMAYLSASR